MSNLETLKQELISQKTAIESKGGVVTVANTNPSPKEITEGINSIKLQSVDLSDSTATEADVLSGKTFYSGDTELKTGTLTISQGMDENMLKHLFLYTPDQKTSEETIYYTLPDYATNVKPYLFHSNKNNIVLTLPSNTTKISEYQFYNCSNFNITNLVELPINEVSIYGLEGTTCVDLENLWPTLTTIGMRGLANAMQPNAVINMPAVSSLGTYAVASLDGIRSISSLNISNLNIASIPNYAFSCLATNGDLTIPSKVTTVGSYCFYRGSFNNITIPSTCTKLSDYCFGSLTSDPTSTYQLKTMTFESNTPPTIGKYFLGTHHVNNGAKIYVPDAALSTYLAVSNLKNFTSIIYPMSQKP